MICKVNLFLLWKNVDLLLHKKYKSFKKLKVQVIEHKGKVEQSVKL